MSTPPELHKLNKVSCSPPIYFYFPYSFGDICYASVFVNATPRSGSKTVSYIKYFLENDKLCSCFAYLVIVMPFSRKEVFKKKSYTRKLRDETVDNQLTEFIYMGLLF